MASSREKQRQQKIPKGSCHQEEAVNPPGTGGVPSFSPARTRGTTREEDRTPWMEQVVERANMLSALRRVEANKGAPGIDGMTTKDLRPFLVEHWPRIKDELLNGTYQPQPVRRVEIPKPGGGVRLLGIPTVLDRLIQQALLQVLSPYYDPTFSPFSYGFRPGRKAHMAVKMAQQYIQEGNRWVVRLKGGDPFLFGRGGEEAEYLRRNGVDFEIVPGVTSAIAAPAYAGIPVTHRDFNSTLTIITGHERPDKLENSVSWNEVAAGHGTLVFLMGMENLPLIVEKLLAGGRSPDTPVALVRWGTLPQQEVLEATLENVVAEVHTHGFRPPAVIVVGEVVRLRQELAWFDRRPLFGKKILVTRARAQASRLVTVLEELGAWVLELPTIAISPLPVTNLSTIISGMERYSWIVFTSVNGVKVFISHLLEQGFDVRDLKGPRVCAIGPATAAEAESWGMRVSAVPEEYRAEAVAEVLLRHAAEGDRILLPRARGAREILPELLRLRGIIVDELEIYEAVPETMLDKEKVARASMTGSITSTRSVAPNSS